jgi:hypothetical protein
MSGNGPVRRWLAALRRRLGLDANPLRRGTDRAETWLRIGLVLAFLAAAPVTAIGLGRWTGTRMASETAAGTAREYPAAATLISGATLISRYPGRSTNWATARWAGPDGTQRTGHVGVPAGARKGSTVQIWTDARGRLRPAPILRAQIASRVITVAGLSAAAVLLLFLTAAGVVHRVLDRRRMRAWEADWTAVEPQWSRRLR